MIETDQRRNSDQGVVEQSDNLSADNINISQDYKSMAVGAERAEPGSPGLFARQHGCNCGLKSIHSGVLVLRHQKYEGKIAYACAVVQRLEVLRCVANVCQ